jgi:hypothetical protein
LISGKKRLTQTEGADAERGDGAVSCIGVGRLQITGRAENNARLGGSIDDFIYAALRPLPTELSKHGAQKYFGGRFLVHLRLYDRQRATPARLRGPLNFKLE